MCNEVRAAGFVIFRRICNKLEYLLMQASYGDHHWTPPKDCVGTNWVKQQPKDFNAAGFRVLIKQWDKCINVAGDYVASHVDPGESDMETALRETEEEAGLKRCDLNIIEDCKKVIKYVVKERPKVVVYWLAEVLNNAPVVVSHEHQAYEWASIDRACELAKFKEMQNVLRDCDEYIHTHNLSA